MSVLTLKKSKTVDTITIKTCVEAYTTTNSTNVLITGTIASLTLTFDLTLAQIITDRIVSFVFNGNIKYKWNIKDYNIEIVIMFTCDRELDFVQLCAFEDTARCVLEKMLSIANVINSTKPLTSAIEDLHGTICNYGKTSQSTHPAKKAEEKQALR